MGQFTTRYAFYLAGGGSTGTIQPDEAVDIDKINDALRSIDRELGIPTVPSGADLPAKPVIDMVRRVIATDDIVRWDGANWVSWLPVRLKAGTMSDTWVSKADPSPLDTRYYTQQRLLDGALDSIYQRKGNYLTSVPAHGQDKHDFKIATGTVTASGFNFNSDTGRYFIGVPVVIPAGKMAGATNVTIFGQAVSQDPGGVTVNEDPGTPSGTGGGMLVVSRRNNFSTTIRWMAVGTS